MAAQYRAARVRPPRAARRAYNPAMIPPRMSGRVGATALILVGALAAAIGLWFGAAAFFPHAPRLAAAVLYPAPRALPAFTLMRSDGAPLTLDDWKGHWTVAFFGYTSCPDVCPTTLAAFKQVWKRLDPATARAVRFDFISVDPERDTPAQLARYVGYFDRDFVAATGSDGELTRLTRALGLVYSREPAADGTYTVDHSASAVIIDPDGNERGLFRPPFEAAAIASDLAALVASR
jgi:protein SCO1